ncbi:MAG: hypothetical protein V5B30_05595 [Candidatus Accumulibacter delftensis]
MPPTTGHVCWHKSNPARRSQALAAPSNGRARSPRNAAAAAPAGKTAVAGGSAVSGEVTLSGKLAGQASPDDVLFVFARAEEGPRMPLAATRATVADLPLRFRFDDSMALAGGKKISDFPASASRRESPRPARRRVRAVTSSARSPASSPAARACAC